MKSYFEIGHDEDDAIVWALEGPVVSNYPARCGTHETLWGRGAINRWRGRLSRKTNELSITPPLLFSKMPPPDWLIEKLRKEFNCDFEILYFNFTSTTGTKI